MQLAIERIEGHSPERAAIVNRLHFARLHQTLLRVLLSDDPASCPTAATDACVRLLPDPDRPCLLRPVARVACRSDPPVDHAMTERYRTIVMDPPWSYLVHPLTDEQREERLNADRDGNPSPRRRGAPADLHYATMTHAEVAALPVADYADTQCHLYLWVTNPRLFADKAGNGPTPAEMMAAWGFEYTTLLTWQKLGPPGLGWYFRGATEHVLFGVKGKLGIASNLRESNHFAATKGRHSAKPDRFYEMVERVSPGPYLELFARRRRYGWDVWGNEAPEYAASQAEMGLVG